MYRVLLALCSWFLDSLNSPHLVELGDQVQGQHVTHHLLSAGRLFGMDGWGEREGGGERGREEGGEGRRGGEEGGEGEREGRAGEKDPRIVRIYRSEMSDPNDSL